MECLKVFGEIGEDFAEKIKYAKWRATHIHSKLMKGETPDPVFEPDDEGILKKGWDPYSLPNI